MDIRVQDRCGGDIDAQVILHPEGKPPVLPDKLVQSVIASGESTGKFLQSVVLRQGPKTIKTLLMGLGNLSDLTQDRLRQAMGRAATHLRDIGVAKFAVTVPYPFFPRVGVGRLAQTMTEGMQLSLYRLLAYKTNKTDKEEYKSVKTCIFVEPNAAKCRLIQAGISRGECIAEGVSDIRTLCNRPSNTVTPTYLAQEAKKIADRFGIRLTVLEREDVRKLGMGGFLGVAQGTCEPPKFIVLEYRPARTMGRATAKRGPVVLVGKSVTFDSGGISLKPPENMEQMKYDMSGGATVLATLKVAAALELPIDLVGILPATDNMPSGSAIHPGDVVTTLSGKTVEVVNTDAEGRLCLADALTYAARYKPVAIIDLATLTGACVISLGHHAMALFSNNARLTTQLKQASDESGERVWELPLWEDYLKQVQSDIADLKNSGGRPAGSITAAIFLKQFVNVPWVHFDIAGTAWNTDSNHPYLTKGSTGIGLRLLIAYLTAEAKGRNRSRR